MFAVRGQGRGGGKSVDDEDSKWEVTKTYLTSITQIQIDQLKENEIRKKTYYIFLVLILGFLY